jgi:hypothetical protein
MANVAVIGTRTEAAFRELRSCVEDLRGLEHQVDKWCERLDRTLGTLEREERVVVEIEMSPALEAAYAGWKRDHPDVQLRDTTGR